VEHETKTKPRPVSRRERDDAYKSNGKHRDALRDEHSIVWRDGSAVIVPIGQTSPRERSTGIASVEALAISIVDRAQVNRGFLLTAEQRGDAVAHLISAAWHEAQRFNGAGRLGGFVTTRLRWRMVDWSRLEVDADSRRGGRPFELVPLDEAATAAPPEHDDRPLWEQLGVELDSLSMPARFALVTLAEPIARGESLSSVAAACEVSRHAARDMLEQLAVELAALGVGP
jgi:hypothetical protein